MVKISIIILVKNGGAYLEEVLERVFSQKVECEFAQATEVTEYDFQVEVQGDKLVPPVVCPPVVDP